MDLSKRGWLKRYIDFRKKAINPQNEAFKNIPRLVDQDKSKPLYLMLQPTGLMYGYPVYIPNFGHHQTRRWSEPTRMKIILLECLIGCQKLLDNTTNNNASETDVETALLEIGKFYLQYQPELFVELEIDTQKPITLEVVEKLIDTHVHVKEGWMGIMNNIFNHNLLFLDVYGFAYQNPDNKKSTDNSQMLEQRNNLYLLVMKVMAACISIDGVDDREKRFYQNFLNLAQLPEPLHNEAMLYIEQPSNLDSIDFSPANTWLLRKYLFEMAVLTAWADQSVSPDEMAFLDNLKDHLQLDYDEVNDSFMAVENFVTTNWKHLHYLHNKTDLQVVSSRLTQRVNKFIETNKKNIITEIRESKELTNLLAKSTREKLTDEERRKVKEQLLDILKTIPSVTLFLLPFGSVILPILLKILPQHLLLPSAFLDKSDQATPESLPAAAENEGKK